MPWEVELPNGDTVRTDRMPVGKVIDLAESLGVSWGVIVEMPTAGSGAVMKAMYQQFCQESGQKPKPGQNIGELAACFKILPAEDEPDDGEPDEDPSRVDAPAES